MRLPTIWAPTQRLIIYPRAIPHRLNSKTNIPRPLHPVFKEKVAVSPCLRIAAEMLAIATGVGIVATANIELKDLKPVSLKDLEGLEDLKGLKVLACPEQGVSAIVPDREAEWKQADAGKDKKNKNKKKKGDGWNTGTVGGIDLGLWVGWI